MGGGLEPREYYPKAKAAALKALELDDTVSHAHVALATTALEYDWNWPDAARHFEKSIALNPSNSQAHERYATYLQSLGRFDDALEERKLALDLDPLSVFRVADVGYPLYFAGKSDEAIRAFRSALDLDSRFFWSHLWIGQVKVRQRQYPEAVVEIERALEPSNRNTRVLATLGNAYGLAAPPTPGRSSANCGPARRRSTSRPITWRSSTPASACAIGPSSISTGRLKSASHISSC